MLLGVIKTIRNMSAYRKILVPVDGSPTSNRGLTEAIRLAKDQGAALRLVHVLDELMVVPGGEAVVYLGNTVDVLREGSDVLLVAVGAMARLGLDAAERAAAQGISVTVVDPRWVSPVPEELVAMAAAHRLVVTVEDNSRAGGVGSAVSQALRTAGVDVPARDLGIPRRFLEHGTRAEVLAEIGLTAQDVARLVVELVAGQEPQPEPSTGEQAPKDA